MTAELPTQSPSGGAATPDAARPSVSILRMGSIAVAVPVPEAVAT